MGKFSKAWIVTISSMLALAVAVMGCQTYGQSAGLGAVIGGTAGAIIGNQSGHAGEGALIGAALGAVTGLVIKDVKVNAEKKREAAATAAAYNYQPSQGQRIYAETAQVMPNPVKPGGDVEAKMEYSVLGTGPGQPVTEVRSLQRDGKTLATVSEDTYTRTDGTWVSTCTFELPANAQPGTYELTQVVKIPNGAQAEKQVAFTVAP